VEAMTSEVGGCTGWIQLTHSLKAPGLNLWACPLTHREKPVTNFALSQMQLVPRQPLKP
jgi:hypothetical protein